MNDNVLTYVLIQNNTIVVKIYESPTLGRTVVVCSEDISGEDFSILKRNDDGHLIPYKNVAFIQFILSIL